MNGKNPIPRAIFWILGPILLFFFLNTVAFGNSYASFIVTFFLVLTLVLVLGGRKRPAAAPVRSAEKEERRENPWTKKVKPATKAGRAVKIFALFVLLLQLFNAATGAVGAGINVGIVLTIVVLTVIGLVIGIFTAKIKQSPVERVRAAEEKLRSGTQKAAQQAKSRPEIKFFRGEEVAEDDFALPSADRGKRRLAQLESFYRAGLYTREEYLAEREKAKQRYHM